MPDTLEDILAREQQPSSEGGDSLDYILENAPSTTGPQTPVPSAPTPTQSGFVRVGPGRVAYHPEAGGLPSVETMHQDAINAAKMGGKIALLAGGPIVGMEGAASLVPQAYAEASPIAAMALKTLLRAGGAGVGGEIVKPLVGETPSFKSGLETARNVALTEGVLRPLAYGLGRAGGVEPSAASAAQDNPALLKPAPAAEYAKAGQDIAKSAADFPETPEHVAYRGLVANRGKVDGMPYVQKMLDSIRPNVDEPTSRLIERKTESLANGLFSKLDPQGKIDATDLDEWIRQNLREPAARVYEKGAGAAWQERLAKMNNELSPQLYTDIGGGAPELQAATSEKLSKVNAPGALMPEQTPGKPNIQTPAYLRQVLSDTDLGHQVRERLSGLDEVTGGHNLDRVKELAMRSSWTGQEKAEVTQILSNLPAIGYERTGMVRAGARAAGRGLTRAIRPAGRIVAVGSTIRGVSQ